MSNNTKHSNRNKPHGLIWIYSSDGGPCVHRMMEKFADEPTPINQGDIVRLKLDGSLAAGGIPGKSLYCGVAENFGEASTLTDHLVIVDPYAIYESQSDADGLRPNRAKPFVNFEFGPGNDEVSGHILDGSTQAHDKNLDAKILCKHDRSNNERGEYVRADIMLNRHARFVALPDEDQIAKYGHSRRGRPSNYSDLQRFLTEVKCVIRSFMRKTGRRPKQPEVRKELGISRSSLYDYLHDCNTTLDALCEEVARELSMRYR